MTEHQSAQMSKIKNSG